MVSVWIGIGGNLGNPAAVMAEAVVALGQRGGLASVQKSPLYRTAPVGGPPGQPDYLNAVIRGETTFDPPALLALLQGVESEFGRVRNERWGSRTIDLDILLYGDMRISTPELQIPHPRITERAFVLVPLFDLDPGLVDPETGARFAGFLPAVACQRITLYQRKW